ncbi:MAG TPA: TerC family protein [Bacteroidia bacterium]|nr:TerC family protein [Bacteroidia bacterium]
MSFAEQLDNLLTLNGLVSLLTLTLLEIVLGIDNIIFISIIAGKVQSPEDRKKARSIGLLLALLMRIALLFGITWIIGLTKPIFELTGLISFFQGMGLEHPVEAAKVTGRDLILFCGGVFLLAKTTSEIHEKIDMADDTDEEKKLNIATVSSVIMQIVFIDIIFSFDSILTAVGIVNEVLIMIAAVVVSMAIMMIFSGKVARFIDEHPTVKMLALAFLLMIGFLLILESFDIHVPKPYVYSSMAFAFLVELLNMRLRKRSAARRTAKKSQQSQENLN